MESFELGGTFANITYLCDKRSIYQMPCCEIQLRNLNGSPVTSPEIPGSLMDSTER